VEACQLPVLVAIYLSLATLPISTEAMDVGEIVRYNRENRQRGAIEAGVLSLKVLSDVFLLLGLSLWFLNIFLKAQLRGIEASLPEGPLGLPSPESLGPVFIRLIVSGLYPLMLGLAMLIWLFKTKKACLLLGKLYPTVLPLIYRNVIQIFIVLLMVFGIIRVVAGVLLLLGFPPVAALGLICGDVFLFRSAPLMHFKILCVPYLPISLKYLGVSIICAIIFWGILFIFLVLLPARKRGIAFREAYIYETLLWSKREDDKAEGGDE